LAEKGLDYVSRPVSLEEGEHIRPAYLAVNPNGVVPTLVHDGQTILDSSVIMEYLDDVFPSPRLSPPTASGRAHMRAWLRYIEEVPTVAVRFPSFNQVFLPHFAKQSAEQFEKDARDRPLRKHFYLRMGKRAFPRKISNNLWRGWPRQSKGWTSPSREKARGSSRYTFAGGFMRRTIDGSDGRSWS